MIAPERLYNFLGEQGIRFYTGVPDSVLKYFLGYVQDHTPSSSHIIAANEGSAIALAGGYHLSTGSVPLVYLQNSGLGNAVNPLTSLAGTDMFAIPMLLLIGWRGKPGTTDEPQHKTMGAITTTLLEAMGIPYYELGKDETGSFSVTAKAVREAKLTGGPVALLIGNGVFDKYESPQEKNTYELEREQVIRRLMDHLTGEEIVICTTGKAGREFYEANHSAGDRIKKYLLNVGAMGHASQLGLGLRTHTTEKIVVIDGDGALIMHAGALMTIAGQHPENFIHIVINNGCHESVGSQPSAGFQADLTGMAAASGYPSATCISNGTDFEQWLNNGLQHTGLQFVEIRTGKHSRENLGRPEGTPAEWKENLMNAIVKKEK